MRLGRDELARRYRGAFAELPGITVQHVDDGDRPAWKDVGLVVDAAVFGVDRDGLAAALLAEGVDTRRYFAPPVHRQHAYRAHRDVALPATDALAAGVLTLPVYPLLSVDDVDRVAELVATIHARAGEVAAAGPKP